jgi:hypothetical protein
MKQTNKIKFSKNKSKNKNSKRKCKNTKTTKKYKKYNKIRGGSSNNVLPGEIIANNPVSFGKLNRNKVGNNERVTRNQAQKTYALGRDLNTPVIPLIPQMIPKQEEQSLSETQKTLRRSAAPTVRNSSGKSAEAETLRNSSGESAEAKTLRRSEEEESAKAETLRRSSGEESAVSTAEQSLSGTQKTLRIPAASTIRQLSEESVADTLRSSSKAETLRSPSNVVSLANSRGNAPSAPSKAPSSASSTPLRRNSMTFTKSSIESNTKSQK